LKRLPAAEERLSKLPVDIVIDHFGLIRAEDGMDAPPFRALLRLLRRGNC
jgi:2-pyrone-4,6-dicarboxylate lactonase